MNRIPFLLLFGRSLNGWPSKWASLDLDFVNDRGYVANSRGTSTERLTISGGVGGTRVNSAGTRVLASAPRINYDPATLECRGLLVEEQRTNKLLNSLVDGTNLSTQTVTVTATAHTLSFYGTGTVTLSGVSTAGPLTGSSATTKSTLTFTPTAGSLTLTVTGSVKYANLEEGSFATSHIPTAGTAATRTADSLTMTGGDFSSWFNASQGTIAAAGTTYAVPAGSSLLPALVGISDGTSNERIVVRRTDSNGFARLLVVDGGAVQAQIDSGPANSFVDAATVAAAYSENDFIVQYGSSASSADTAGTLPTVTQMQIGFGPAQNYWNGHIRRLRYYPRRLSNGELQGLTY